MRPRWRSRRGWEGTCAACAAWGVPPTHLPAKKGRSVTVARNAASRAAASSRPPCHPHALVVQVITLTCSQRAGEGEQVEGGGGGPGAAPPVPPAAAATVQRQRHLVEAGQLCPGAADGRRLDQLLRHQFQLEGSRAQPRGAPHSRRREPQGRRRRGRGSCGEGLGAGARADNLCQSEAKPRRAPPGREGCRRRPSRPVGAGRCGASPNAARELVWSLSE